jgi:thiamine-monophosphate kinase
VSEREILDWLRKTVGNGIGDDCAVYIPRKGEDLLFTNDQSIEGVHFAPGLAPGAVGERAVARAISDIAAMGGEPRFCLLSLAMPKAKGMAWAKRFFRGALKARVPLVGGDLAHGDKIHIDVVVCGAVPHGRALRRDGAKIGDLLYVSGALGKAWDRKRIEPRLAFGKLLRGRATSCIDVSDGLSLDLRRVCEASGVSAEVDHVPIARGSTLERALHGGEDYELLFTMPSRFKPPQGSFRIGRIVPRIGSGVMYQGLELPARGYDHFGQS